MASLAEALATLAPWPAQGDLTAEQWDRHLAVAAAVQSTEASDVERALGAFLRRAQGSGGDGDESRVFLLMRVVFDLPETAPVEQRRSFKGWVNWPPPAPDGTVSLAWPLTWTQGRPALVEPYEGSEGPAYAATEEYRHLRETFAFRVL